MVRHCVEDRRGGSAVAAYSSYAGWVSDRGAGGHPCQDLDQRDADIPFLAILGHRPDCSESVDKVKMAPLEAFSYKTVADADFINIS